MPNTKYQIVPMEGDASLVGELPGLIEEAGGDDFARVAAVRRDGNVEDGVVRQLGDLTGVVQVIVFAKGESAVQHDVAVWIFGIRIKEHGDVLVRDEILTFQMQLAVLGAQRQALGDSAEVRVRLGRSPEDE